MRNSLIGLLFISYCSNLSAQSDLQEAYSKITGNWVGITELVVQSDSFFENVEILKVELKVSFHVQFLNDGTYFVALDKVLNKRILEPKNPNGTLRNTVYKGSFHRYFREFLDENTISTTTYSIFHNNSQNLILNLGLQIEPGYRGRKLGYLTKDLGNIIIDEIGKEKIILRVKSRTNWNEEKKQYDEVKWVTITLMKFTP